MKTKSFTFTVMAALLVFSVGLFGNANAARRVCDDGTYPPCDDSGGGMQPPDLGDLIILYRNDNGVPILTPEVGATGLCQQPVAFNNATTCPTSLLDCSSANPCLVPVDQTTCAVELAFAGCTQEVDFGRINEARSPPEVMERQLDDVVVTLSTADCLTLDPAGRMVASQVNDTTLDNLLKTVDSPLQNLAIYRQLMLTGYLGDAANPIVLPGGVLDTAARGIGAASDKTGEVNVDLVAYLNQIMGLSDPATPTILGKFCIDVREEVKGVVQLVQKCFLDYSAYGYDRSSNFGALPDPAYIPESTPMDGWFEYMTVLDPTLPSFTIQRGPILDAVFCVDSGGLSVDPVAGICTAQIDPGFTAGNIGGFTQAADDSRAVINYMHTWPVPVGYETPVPCAASGVIAYDVSISEESGLQVPRQYVNGTEREFIVTVSNASTSTEAASGTVTVTAVTLTGASVPGFPRVLTFTDLVPGTSASWTEPLFVDLGSSTTIAWTATAVAPYDVNLTNNSVTAVTSVKNTGGGGGQGGRP